MIDAVKGLVQWRTWIFLMTTYAACHLLTIAIFDSLLVRIIAKLCGFWLGVLPPTATRFGGLRFAARGGGW